MGFYDDTAANENSSQLVVPEQQPQHHGPAYGAAPNAQQQYQQHTMAMAGGYYSGPLTDQRPQSGGVVAIAWIVALVTAFYMLPWAIAVTRGRSNVTSIGLINLLLGWSLIAWVISFVMSLQSHRIVAIAHAPVQIVVNSASAHGPAAPVPAPPVVHGVPTGWVPGTERCRAGVLERRAVDRPPRALIRHGPKSTALKGQRLLQPSRCARGPDRSALR